MANVIKSTDKQAKDSRRQKNRQSVDFKDIWNIQTDMNVSDYEWDQIFHDWLRPDNCTNNKSWRKCLICQELKENGFAIRKSDGKTYYNK